MKRIAFFGGSFDPPHRGHLAIAKAAADQFVLDQVLFAPVAHQPLKNTGAATPFVHRYAMTVLATQADARFVPSLLDAPREHASQPNYTVETLGRLRAVLAALPEPATLFTLLGADSWLNIAQWHHAPQLLALSDWIVAARPGVTLPSAEDILPAQVTVSYVHGTSKNYVLLRHPAAPPTRVWFLPFVQEDISATELRVALDAGESTAEFLPQAVSEYIRKTGLYHASSNPILGTCIRNSLG